MKRKMIIGRYMEGYSWLHRLDPRSKTAAMPLFMISVFLVSQYIDILLLSLFAITIIYSSRIPLQYFFKAVKPLLFIILFIFLFQLFFNASGGKLLDLGVFSLYSGGLERAVISALRMILFIMFAVLLTFTTPPDRLAAGLGRLLRPLQLLGVRSDKLALMLSIALRFIPTIFEEAERLWKAQVSRGLDLRSRPLKQRAQLIIALLTPVTAGAFRRAVGLADSMEARGYQVHAPRVLFRKLTWNKNDTLFIILFLLPILILSLLQ